jgi:hypothetical protein
MQLSAVQQHGTCPSQKMPIFTVRILALSGLVTHSHNFIGQFRVDNYMIFLGAFSLLVVIPLQVAIFLSYFLPF